MKWKSNLVIYLTETERENSKLPDQISQFLDFITTYYNMTNWQVKVINRPPC